MFRSVLKNHTREIKSGKEALQLKGVGKKIAIKIDQILATGITPIFLTYKAHCLN